MLHPVLGLVAGLLLSIAGTIGVMPENRPELIVVDDDPPPLLNCNCTATLGSFAWTYVSCPCQRVTHLCFLCNCCKKLEDHCFTFQALGTAKKDGECDTAPGCQTNPEIKCCFAWKTQWTYSICCEDHPTCASCNSDCCEGGYATVVGRQWTQSCNGFSGSTSEPIRPGEQTLVYSIVDLNCDSSTKTELVTFDISCTGPGGSFHVELTGTCKKCGT